MLPSAPVAENVNTCEVTPSSVVKVGSLTKSTRLISLVQLFIISTSLLILTIGSATVQF